MRVLIVDDHEVVRRGVRSLLSSEDGIEVCGEAVDGQNAIAKARELRPDVITMDISMPNLNGLEATREIRRILPDVYILILSQHDVPEMMQQALNAGANGYIVKSALSTDLVATLEKVTNGQRSFDPTVYSSTQTNIDTQEVLQRSAAFEKALRESEERLRMAQQVARVGTFEWNIKTGVNRWTPELEAMYGLAPGAFPGTQAAWEQLVHPEDRQETLRAVERAMAGAVFEREWRVIWPDNSVHWLLGRAWVFKDKQGQPERLTGINIDITERKRAEEALQESRSQLALALESSRKSEERFRAIVGTTPECVKLVARDGTLLYMNPSGLEMVGADRAEMIVGTSVYDLIASKDRERFREFHQRICAGEKGSLEFDIIGLDGTARRMETHAAPLRDTDGVVVQLAVSRDVSERERAQHAIVEKARLLDLSTDAIIVRDAADRVTFWNEGATQTYGYTPEKALGRVTHELFRTEFPEPFEHIKETFLRNGYWSGELRHTRADGSKIVVSSRWSVERDARGNVASILETNRDIGEQKNAEHAQYRLAAIVESSDDAIVSKDLNGVITSWNAGAQRIFGFTPEEAIGQPITIIIPPELQAEEKQILSRLRAGERIDHFETIRRTKDGRRRHLSLTISPVRDARGRIIGASKIARDITERKQIEQVLKEAELSGRLLQLQDEERRRVARELHDGVGQLLAALSMNVAIVAKEKEKLSVDAARCVEENRAFIEQAITEIRTLSHLLHPPFLHEVGLVPALTEYVHGFGKRSNIRVTLDLPANLQRLPRDYEMCLFRIVQECLTNIHRHSGSATAQVRLSHVPGEIQLEVSDQGRGISPEIQQGFFAGKNTGVGFRGMRERVRQLGGALQIHSRGEGASIMVVLPIRDGAVQPSNAETPRSNAERPGSGQDLPKSKAERL